MFRPYNAKVLVGNWYEDRVLDQDVIKDYLDRRNNNELYTQKQGALNAKINSPIQLSTVNDNRIHIGDVVLLKCDGTSNQPSSLVAKANRKDCFVSANGTQAQGITSPVVNLNTALIVRSVDGSAEGSAIKYGQAFALSTLDGNLFLHSDTRSYDHAALRSRLQPVAFSTVYNHECDWVATCLNPKFRLEAEGSDVPANEKIVILHMKTNKALGVVTDFSNSAKFELVANTFLNSHKAEEDVNHWKFVTNVPCTAQPEPRYN